MWHIQLFSRFGIVKNSAINKILVSTIIKTFVLQALNLILCYVTKTRQYVGSYIQ